MSNPGMDSNQINKASSGLSNTNASLLRYTASLLVWLLAACSAICAPSSMAAQNSKFQQILVIFGNHDIGTWERDFNDLFLRTLPQDADIRVTLEFLPLLNPNSVDMAGLAQSVNIKRKSLAPDLRWLDWRGVHAHALSRSL